MAKRKTRISDSLRQLGEIQVTEWDFMALLNKEIEIGKSLRRLGSRRVTEWEFKEVVPALQKLARQEVDVVGWVKRAANIKVMEWDCRNALPGVLEPRSNVAATPEPPVRPEETLGEAAQDVALPEVEHVAPGEEALVSRQEALVIRSRNFLLFLAANLVDVTNRAEVRVEQAERGVVRFRLVVAEKDLKAMLGRHGETAAAIRSLLKGSAEAVGLYVLLEIVSVAEDLARTAKKAQRSKLQKSR